MVEIYTDGSCKNNPGPGGCAAIVLSNGTRQELTLGFNRTTNNRMEMKAVIIGLESVEKGASVTIYTDSRLICDAFNQRWILSWEMSRWYDKPNKCMRANHELWKDMLKLVREREVTFVWVKGHSNNEENENADRLASAAALGDTKTPDIGYECQY